MQHFKLVLLPFIITLFFVLVAISILMWREKKIKGISGALQGSYSIVVLAVSLFILAGLTLFTGLFFLISG